MTHAEAPVQLTCYSMGLVYASACTSIEDDEDAVDAMNIQYPSGTEAGWRISDDKTFASGQPNPCPCNQVVGRRHLLFEC